MDKNRILLFIFLSFAVLLVFRPQPPATPTKTGTPAGPANVPPATPPASSTPSVQPAVQPGAVPVPLEEIEAEGPEPDIVIDNELYTATLSNIGAKLTSYRLKAFPDSKGGTVELVNQKDAPDTGWPLTIDSGDPARNARLAAAKYRGRQEGSTVVYEWASDGTYARKELKFDATTYTFSFETRLSQDGKPVLHWIQWNSGFGDTEVQGGGVFCWVGWGSCEDINRHAIVDITPAAEAGAAEAAAKFDISIPLVEGTQEKVESGAKPAPAAGPVVERTSNRAGMEDQYFVLMLTMPDRAVTRFVKTAVTESYGPIGLISLSVPMQRGPIRVYAGPRDRSALEKADPKLGNIVDFGWFFFITQPLAKALLWLHGYVGNFGWSIILLTCAINFALFPLRLKQQRSMLKMQKIQPQLRTLQDKLKKLKPGDPRRNEIQTQTMDLYKTHGINPIGGCLPLLLQMPFLFAFYTVLSITIELRRAPWMLWIQDLSQRDPYFIMPILMAVSMFAMQKMTPQVAMDPQQQKMMAIMPLMMVFMFLSSPSGLMVYWLTSNLIGMGQQVFITKYWSGNKTVEVAAD